MEQLTGYIFDCSVAGLVIASLLLSGFAILSCCPAIVLGGLELPTAVAAGIVVHGLIGLCLSLQPFDMRLVAIGAISLAIVASAVTLYKKRISHSALWRDAKAPILLWTLFCFSALAVAQYPSRLPASMPDGAWIVKKNILSVRIQNITGALPMDNIIPTVAGEYLYRHIGFRRERPLVPGQEVTNRPILASLVALPFRAAVGPVASYNGKLPRLEYVGTSWPDFSIFIEDRIFSVYLAVGVVLNATLLLAFCALLAQFGVPHVNWIGFLILATSPYFLMQTLFTWPKSLAGFFIIIGAIAQFKFRRPSIGGVLTGLGYWAHPYAIGFCIVFVAWEACVALRSPRQFRFPVRLASAMALVILPWPVWSGLIVRIPSDLVSQNLVAAKPLLEHAIIRWENLRQTMLPFGWQVWHLNRDVLSNNINFSYWGVLGPVLGFLAIPLVALAVLQGNPFAICTLISACLLGAVFSTVNPIVLHGWQAAGPIFIGVTLLMMRRYFSQKAIVAVILLQVVFNLWSLTTRAQIIAPEKLVRLTLWPEIITVDQEIKPGIGVPVTMDGIERSSVFSASPAKVIFSKVPISDGDVLTVSVGLHPAVYDQLAGDGATFRILVGQGAKSEEVQKVTVDPAHVIEARGWTDLQVPLSVFAGTAVSITFYCDPGPNNNKFADWCIWGAPAIQRH